MAPPPLSSRRRWRASSHQLMVITTPPHHATVSDPCSEQLQGSYRFAHIMLSL